MPLRHKLIVRSAQKPQIFRAIIAAFCHGQNMVDLKASALAAAASIIGNKSALIAIPGKNLTLDGFGHSTGWQIARFSHQTKGIVNDLRRIPVRIKFAQAQ